MKTLRTTISAAAAALLLAGAFLPVVHAADKAPATSQPVNTKCPLTGEDIDPKVTTTYNGKTYAFCCADCIKSFQKDPEKYAKNAK